jgi:hypothetical protein
MPIFDRECAFALRDAGGFDSWQIVSRLCPPWVAKSGHWDLDKFGAANATNVGLLTSAPDVALLE